jgi:serine/threonine protein kinase
MTRERFRKIRDLYETALELNPAQRDGFLERECQGDEDLRGEVARLLTAREHAPKWLSHPLIAPADPFLTSRQQPSGQMEGRRLGGYRIVQEIGHGGMGFVYLAERVDGVIRKQVAIKLVRPWMHDPDMLQRFKQERQILASLDHPAIARLLDGGSTEEGWPYLIMDYVEGQPIDRWCDERKLNVTERLILFRKVCAAVQYAHQHLIVHRDLKPANILVTASGEPKLLDFGIAKLLEPQSAAGSLTATATQMRIMTPQYASPEQVKGEAITTLTDVYSLGVVLYELLTGHRPYRLTSLALHEQARVICEVEPTRPSIVVTTLEGEASDSSDTAHPVTPEMVSETREGSPNRLQRRLAGDLDSVSLMALRKEPTRRYSSVEQFSEDVRRHLEQLPVIARKDSIWYRAAKLIHRHPGGVAAAVLVLLSIITGLFTTLWEGRIARQQGRSNGSAFSPPLILLFQYGVIVLLGSVIYFSRATVIRVMGALAGSVLFALTYVCVHRHGSWHVGFMLILVCFGAVLLLLFWRIARRFGWRAQAAFTIGAAIAGPLRERVVGRLMDVTFATPLLADMAIWAIGLVIAQGVMRIVAGPARGNRLARSR